MRTKDMCETADNHPSLLSTPSASQDSFKSVSGGRLISLDALRGFNMFWIVGASALVGALKNVSDTGFFKGFSAQLSHVQWEGFNFIDLIFPMFVFISGISLVFSLDKTMAREGKAKAVKRIVVRSVWPYSPWCA